MFNLPIQFTSQATASKSFEEPWKLNSDKLHSICSIPKDFGGIGGELSPEDLYLQSVISCFIGTFKVLAKNSKLDFTSLDVTGRLYVDKNEYNKVIMKSIILKIALHNPDRTDRATSLVEKAIKTGFIINSVKTEILYDLELK